MRSHVFKTKLNSILKDNKFDRFVSGKTRGELDFNSLSKINYSSKIFKRKEARKNKDYKLIVLADASGSMRGTPASSVMESLTFLNEALAGTDVSYAIWSFGGDILCLKDFQEKPKDNIAKLYKDHLHKRKLLVCHRCSTINGTYEVETSKCSVCNYRLSVEPSYWYNADGLALHLAQERIEQEGGNHIIIVLSDGDADAIGDIKHCRYLQKDGLRYGDMNIDSVAKKVIEKKTILCSIGIENRDVLRHYPKENTIVIEESVELGDALVKLISKRIHRGL